MSSTPVLQVRRLARQARQHPAQVHKLKHNMHRRTGSCGHIETYAAVVAPIVMRPKVRLPAQTTCHREMQIKVAEVVSAQTQN
jgi:hypothetical protein